MFLLAADDGRTALIEASSGTRLSYSALAARVRSAAADLHSAAKQLIAVLGEHDLRSVIAYLAAIEAGHAVAWIDPSLAIGAFHRLLATYRPEIVVCGSRPLAFPAPPGYSVLEDRALGWLWRATEPVSARPLHPELACLLSTSGSTGHAKLVRLRRDSLVENARAIVQTLGITADDVAITSLPVAHAFGLSVLDAQLAAGGAVVVTDNGILQPSFWRLCRDERVTTIAGVPFTFEVLRRLDPARVVPATVTRMIQAGGRLDVDHVRAFCEHAARRGSDFRVMYGQTEATARIAVWPAVVPDGKVASVGRAIPGGSLRIDTETGEVVYRGPNVMMGYADGRDDLARGNDIDELFTGDLGWLDDDGFLFLTGRIRRIAKIAGHRVNLDDVESMLVGVTAAAVEADGVLAVCVEAPYEANLADTARTLACTLGLDPSLVRVARVDRLPRSPAGKIQYPLVERAARI